MKPGCAALVALALLTFALISSSLYVVAEYEQVILTQFGDPVGEPVSSAGLHFKLPFVQQVNSFDRRLMIWDGEPNQIPTADKRYIFVDTTARWRIVDPLLFLQAVRTELGAKTRLDDILDSATRDIVSSHKLIEVVRLSNRVLDLPLEVDGVESTGAESRERIEFGRDKLVEKIYQSAAPVVKQYGIELIDVMIKRLEYVQDVRRTVYQRMISERQRIAERYRSEGRGRKAEIDGERAREEKTIRSLAYKDAQTIVATADAEAATIYAEAYGKDPEFYAFWRTMETYGAVVGPNTTLVLPPTSDLYRYMTEGPPK